MEDAGFSYIQAKTGADDRSISVQDFQIDLLPQLTFTSTEVVSLRDKFLKYMLEEAKSRSALDTRRLEGQIHALHKVGSTEFSLICQTFHDPFNLDFVF